MPVRTGCLWCRVCKFSNILNGYFAMAKSRRYHKAVLRYTSHLEDNLIGLLDAFGNLHWQPSMSVVKTVFWPKRRIITAPIAADRVAFHAIVDVIAPYFEKKFIFHSYACRKNKGTHRAVDIVHRHAYGIIKWNGSGYAAKYDIENYFGTINHEKLKQIIRKTIKDPDLLVILDRIIDRRVIEKPVLKRILQKTFKDGEAAKCFAVVIDAGPLNERMLKRMLRSYISDQEQLKFLDRIIFAACHPEVGLPLGALTSQLFANVYLDQLDHFVKEHLRVKHYVRYMDDFIIMDINKTQLHATMDKVAVFLQQELCLRLNAKTSIFPIERGIDFCGYRIFPDRIVLRKRNIVSARHRLKKLRNDYEMGAVPFWKVRASIMSFLGHAKHCNAYHTVESILQGLTF